MTRLLGRTGGSDQPAFASPNRLSSRHVDRDRLGPAEKKPAAQESDEREQSVPIGSIDDGAERQPASRRAVGAAQTIGRPGMRRLVNGQRQHEDDELNEVSEVIESPQQDVSAHRGWPDLAVSEAERRAALRPYSAVCS